MKKSRLKNLNARIKEDKVTFTVYVILRIFVVLSAVVAVLRGNYENLFYCVLTLVLFITPFFAEENFGIELPRTLEIIILLFIFAAEILGELQCYYLKVPHWDTMLHTVNGFLCAAIGFSLVDMFNRTERMTFRLSPLYMAIVAFCFSMTIGVLWEFFEFGGDMIFHTDMQKDTVISAIYSVDLNPTGKNIAVGIENITEVYINGEPLGVGGYLDIGLIDTMKDLFVNFIGAVIFSIIGFFYVKGRGQGRFAQNFIPTVVIGEDAEASGSPEQVCDGSENKD